MKYDFLIVDVATMLGNKQNFVEIDTSYNSLIKPEITRS